MASPGERSHIVRAPDNQSCLDFSITSSAMSPFRMCLLGDSFHGCTGRKKKASRLDSGAQSTCCICARSEGGAAAGKLCRLPLNGSEISLCSPLFFFFFSKSSFDFSAQVYFLLHNTCPPYFLLGNVPPV